MRRNVKEKEREKEGEEREGRKESINGITNQTERG